MYAETCNPLNDSKAENISVFLVPAIFIPVLELELELEQ